MDFQSAFTPQVQEFFKPGNLPLLIAAFLLGAVILTGLLADILLLFYLRARPLDSRRMADRMRPLPWDWRAPGAVVLALIALHGCTVLLVGILRRFTAVGDQALTLTAIFLQSLLFPLVVIMVVAALISVSGRSWKAALGLRTSSLPRDIMLGGFLYLATMPVMAFYSMVYMKLLHFLNFPVFRQDVLQFLADSSQPLWMRAHLVILAVAIAPVFEEIFFRGIALPAAARHLRPIPAACLVSLLFSVMHFHIPSIVPLFVIAMSFSLAYLRTGSLIVPIVMHAIFNAVSIAALLLLRDMQDILPI